MTTALSFDEATEYTESLAQIFAGSWRQIFLAEKIGVPKACGLTTQQWVEERLGGYVRLSIPDRREAGAELAEEGLSNVEAAEVLGVSDETVRRDKAATNVESAATEPIEAEGDDATNVEPPAFMEDWKGHEILQGREQFNALPDDMQETMGAMLSEPGIPATTAIDMLTNVAKKEPAEQAQIAALYKSDDGHDRDLAVTHAAALPPMPDPRAVPLGDAAKAVALCSKLVDDEYGKSLKGQAKELRRIRKQIEEAWNGRQREALKT